MRRTPELLEISNSKRGLMRAVLSGQQPHNPPHQQAHTFAGPAVDEAEITHPPQAVKRIFCPHPRRSGLQFALHKLSLGNLLAIFTKLNQLAVDLAVEISAFLP